MDFDPEKKYPVIIDIHGGPKTIYGEVFYHEMQYWAGKGYFVIFCNPTGSDGRGDFMNILGKYGTVDYEDMPRRFLEVCRRKSDYLGQLNRNLGRATMNLTWKNRFLESRDAVMVQFEEMAGILEEFSGQMERAADVTAQWEPALQAVLKKRRIAAENVLVLQYEEEQRELFFTARMTNGRCMTARDAAELVGRAMKGTWSPSKDGKTIITRNAAAFRFIEDGRYRMLFGSSRVPRSGEEISGDSYTLKNRLPGQAIMSLSDGMGSGRIANEDSEKVIELSPEYPYAYYSIAMAYELKDMPEKAIEYYLLYTGIESDEKMLDIVNKRIKQLESGKEN
jgi:stage II sporulation protein E